jgi:FtsP/CotA-like multicopper oxidase with cupredoxin domain
MNRRNFLNGVLPNQLSALFLQKQRDFFIEKKSAILKNPKDEIPFNERVAMLGGFQEMEVDFIANNSRKTLFHCHMQLHMDFGFMALFD